ncbi:MAG: SDR family NAD(P)-dependent oxidoreductase [Gluconacetobacter diazotrophicus]|nr:SDR family NAD(P)-dependent oxidoreductase [Gluconacetobacter diazotrophicus]
MDARRARRGGARVRARGQRPGRAADRGIPRPGAARGAGPALGPRQGGKRVTHPGRVLAPSASIAAQAHKHFSRFDAVLNNAGYSLAGAVEGVGEAAVRAVFDTNYFGPLRVIQAALSLLRPQGGRIVGISSGVGPEA